MMWPTIRVITIMWATKGATLTDAYKADGPVQTLQGVEWIRLADKPSTMSNGEGGALMWIVGANANT